MDAALRSYCGSEFWNSTLAIAAVPRFTPCFQHTVLVWVPCGFLWLFSIVHLWTSSYFNKTPVKQNNLHIAKLVTNVFIILLNMTQLINQGVQQDPSLGISPPSEFVTPIIIIVTMVLALVVQIHVRLKGQVTSGLLSLFWFLFVISMIVPFYMKVQSAIDQGINNMMAFVSFFIFFGLVLLQFIFITFAEPSNNYDEQACPELHSSAINQLFFSWLTPLILLGYKKSLVHDDLFHLNESDKSAKQGELLAKEWAKELKKSGSQRFYKPSLTNAMIRSYGITLLVGMLYRLVRDVIQFLSPILLGLLINFTEDSSTHLWLGIVYAFAMYAVALIRSTALHQSVLCCFKISMRIRTGVMSMVYKKSLKISNSSKQESTIGEIVNLAATDAQRLMDLMPYINLIWSGPLVISVAIGQLWAYLGPSVLAGVAVIIFMIPINGLIAKRIRSTSSRQMKLRDKRIKLMNEILNGIKVLKLYAWEPSFDEQITKIRNDELKLTRNIAYLRAVVTFLWITTPVFVSLSSLAMYVLIDSRHSLDSETAFVSLTLFNILRFPLAMFPQVITNLAYSQVSIKRITRFLLLPEVDPEEVNSSPDKNVALNIEHGTFSWDETSIPVLYDININVKPGSLVAVVGEVGAGKSSLISSILGEMDKRSGNITVNGSIAYVPQQAWIQNATLMDNILFGKKLKDGRENNFLSKVYYKKIIKATALKHDLKILQAGDQTEIGEKGLNLSGGQKQRVSLARAVCSDRDIYLLDDPLSAVDSLIGKHIFDHVIGPNGLLREKTRILVTHGIQYLPNVDYILVMNAGEITEIGTYKELLERKGEFSKFLNEFGNKKQTENAKEYFSQSEDEVSSGVDSVEEFEQIETEEPKKSNTYGTFGRKKDNPVEYILMKSVVKGKKLIEEEGVNDGNISLKVVKAYTLDMGIKYCVLINVFFILYESAYVGGNSWLSAWTNYNVHTNFTAGKSEELGKWLGGYGSFGCVQAIAILCTYLTIATASIIAARLSHKKLLSNILKCPSYFFDTTPLGRIVNRFAKDMYIVDEKIPNSFKVWLKCVYDVLGTLFVIIFATPLFAVVIIPLAVVYYFAQRYYIVTSRQLKRLEAVTLSPIYSHFAETLSGLHVVRAFKHQERFIKQSENKVDYNQECYYPNVVSNRWLAIRLEVIGNAVVFFAALFAVLSRSTVSGSLVGLSVSYALTITSTLNIWVRQTSELETNIVSVERIKEYSEIENEETWWKAEGAPRPDWPNSGQIAFKDYGTRYRKGLDLVLKNVSFNIKPKQKVGIVGRTGAGKSSLTLALFRLIEPANGTITIDGVDISKIGLHQLRNKLTIIPQDPVLFSGSMRINLDPFGMYSDDQIWKCLKLAHLKEYVSGLNGKLDYICAEGGENLSVGQKQLVCLARALLRKTKILILDEATAAVDMQTDDLIQNTIRTEFANCTVITIAHRLNTIMDYDNILVLSDGEVAEFGSPAELLRTKGTFFAMAKDAGIV